MAKKSKRCQLSEEPGWREAACQAMLAATEKEAQARHGDENYSFNYRWEHVKSVVNISLRLAALVNADAEVVEAAAWLHDIRKDSSDNHPIEGASFAREFLPGTDFPPAKIEAVALAIEEHMGLWLDQPLDSLESQVLWDADKLTKIGLTAAFHWTGRHLAGATRRSLKELIDRARKVDWQEQTVASMHTEPARRAARLRLDAYNHLWDALDAELNGDDLLAGE